MRITPNFYITSCFQLACIGILVGMLLILISPRLNAAPTAYTDETEFHNALALLGLAETHEGFEDEAAWGGVRSTIVSGVKTASSISNLGMTWTSNYLAGNITTGEGPARSGNYGFYSSPHGSYANPGPGADCHVPGECGDGWRGMADNGIFLAMGGYIDTNTPYAKLGMYIGQYPNNPVDFGETCDVQGENCVSASTIGTTKVFFGVIDPDGFSSFEYREREGVVDDLKYIYADDFYFVIAQPPVPATIETLFVPMTPCRLLDTRKVGGAFGGGTTRSYRIWNGGLDSHQGGTPTCNIPENAVAVQINFTAVDPSGAGYLRAWPNGQAEPTATMLAFHGGVSISNSVSLMFCNTCGDDMDVKIYGATTQLIAESLGYYEPLTPPP